MSVAEDIQAVLDGTRRWVVIEGDCLAVMPMLGDKSVDLLCTDPPYGIGTWSCSGGNSLSAAEASDINAWDVAPPSELLQLAISRAKRSIVWGGNYLVEALGAFRSPLIWDKGNRGVHFADGELAWTSFDFGTLRILNLRADESETGPNRQHPTQKPVGVMLWCIEQARVDRDAVILDPFCGSGTTGVACLRLGRRFIGIEKDARHAAIARERLAAEDRGLSLRDARAGQTSIFDLVKP